MEKLITFGIPCYNSAEYMGKCIESLLPGGDDIEIIIVDDGSTDDTARIADEYEAKYPGICRAIHQENGGHGEDVTDSSTDIEFYFNTDAPNLAMSTCSDNTTFADFNESEDWPYANGGGSVVNCVCHIGYFRSCGHRIVNH